MYDLKNVTKAKKGRATERELVATTSIAVPQAGNAVTPGMPTLE